MTDDCDSCIVRVKIILFRALRIEWIIDIDQEQHKVQYRYQHKIQQLNICLLRKNCSTNVSSSSSSAISQKINHHHRYFQFWCCSCKKLKETTFVPFSQVINQKIRLLLLFLFSCIFSLHKIIQQYIFLSSHHVAQIFLLLYFDCDHVQFFLFLPLPPHLLTCFWDPFIRSLVKCFLAI